MPVAPSKPDRRPDDEDRASGRPLRRVETDLPGSGSSVDERPRVDRPASEGDSDDGGREVVVGGRPGALRRWPDVGRQEQGETTPDDDETSDDDDDDDDDEPSDDDDRRRHAPATRGASSSLHSTSTATPDDSSLVLQRPAQSELAGGQTIVTHATVI